MAETQDSRPYLVPNKKAKILGHIQYQISSEYCFSTHFNLTFGMEYFSIRQFWCIFLNKYILLGVMLIKKILLL